MTNCQVLITQGKEGLSLAPRGRWLSGGDDSTGDLRSPLRNAHLPRCSRASRSHHNLTLSRWQLSCPPSFLHKGAPRARRKSLAPGALGPGAARVDTVLDFLGSATYSRSLHLQAGGTSGLGRGPPGRQAGTRG